MYIHTYVCYNHHIVWYDFIVYRYMYIMNVCTCKLCTVQYIFVQNVLYWMGNDLLASLISSTSCFCNRLTDSSRFCHVPIWTGELTPCPTYITCTVHVYTSTYYLNMCVSLQYVRVHAHYNCTYWHMFVMFHLV